VAEQRHTTAHAVWVLALIALGIWPLSAVVDWLVYAGEGFLSTLLIARVFTWGVLGLFTAGLYGLRRKGLDARLSHLLAWVLAGICAVYLTYVCLVAGGSESPFYAGTTLLMFAMLVALPWHWTHMAFLMAALIVQFDLAMLLFDDTPDLVALLTANYFFLATSFIGLLWTVASHRMRVQVFLGRVAVERERARSEGLLLNVLPPEVARELKQAGKVKARHIDACTILFTDFVGFTKLADRVPPGRLVDSLDRAFSRFDEIVSGLGLEKLKTIGDAYMCAGGVVEPQPDHLVRCVLAGLQMLEALEDDDLRAPDGIPWRMRVGVHCGPVVAGVIGQTKFAYDLWGDTVNTASRLESAAQPRSINLATGVYKRIEPFFVGVDRGFVPVRGKGPLAMTRVTRLRREYSADDAGRHPNERFALELRRWLRHTPPPMPVAAGRPEPAPGASSSAEQSALQVLTVLPELSANDRAVLLSRSELVRYDAGQILVEQGQGLKMLLLVVRGQAAVRISREGRSIEVGRVRPGEPVGELSFVSWEPASATVVALEPLTALRLDLDWMEGVLASHPDTAARLFHSLALVLAERVRQANARLFTWGPERDLQLRDQARRRLTADLRDSELGAMARSLCTTLRGLAEEVSERRRLAAAVADECDRFVGLAAARAAELADGQAAPFLPEAAALVLRETFPVFMSSPTLERLYTKPLGQPLDYLAARSVWGGVPMGHGPLGRAVDSWFLGRALCRSLVTCQRASAELLRRRHSDHREGELRVCVLESGAGPGLLEALRALRPPEQLRMACVDSDLGSLWALGQEMSDGGVLAERLTLVCESVLDPAERRETLRLLPQHLMLLPVLMDCPDESVLVYLLDELHANLADQGAVVVGLVDLPPEDRFIMDALLDWRPNMVTPQDVLAASSQSAFGPDSGEVITLDGGQAALVVLTRSES